MTAPSKKTEQIVMAACRHLQRAHLRDVVVRNAAIVLGAAAVCAMARPFVWPLVDGHVYKSALRALLFASTGSAITTTILIARAWKSRPTMLTSARSLDEALGLSEVIASGFAFAGQESSNELKAIAVSRASQALDGVVIEQTLSTTKKKKRERSPREIRILRAAFAALVIGLGFGAIDRLLVNRAIHPTTSRETAAANELSKTAEQLAANKPADPKQPAAAVKDPKAEEVAEAARRAAEAAKNGDRQRAMDALEDMRKAQRSMEAEERDQARALRALRDDVEGGGAAAEKGEKGERPSGSASEAMSKLEKDYDKAAKEKDSEAMKKLAERLEKAEAAARANADKARKEGKDGKSSSSSSAAKDSKPSARESAWSRAAEAMKEAREAAARGDTEAAKKAMERAEREIAAMEKAAKDPSKASAMAKMSEEASELDRSMREGMSGSPGKEAGKDSKLAGGESGKDGKDGKDAKDAKDGRGESSRGKPGDPSDPGGKPGGGPGGSDKAPGPEQRRVKVNGSLQARTDAKEGERAVSAIEGMGRGDDPKAYKEIFPAYDSVVEDGLHEEVVPAARRPTVRRYFSLIRPNGTEHP